MQGWLILFWLVLWAVAIPIGWISSVAFISHVTMATAVLTSFAAWASGRVEVKQDLQDPKTDTTDYRLNRVEKELVEQEEELEDHEEKDSHDNG
jgi:hypothetical protein